MLILFITIPADKTEAQVTGGIRAGIYADQGDPLIGGELLFPVSDRVYINPNIEYVFVDVGNMLTFNADAHYDFPVESVYLWAGGGLGIQYFSFGGFSNTDAVLDIISGVGLKNAGSVIPYAQLKLALGNGSDVEFALGIRF